PLTSLIFPYTTLFRSESTPLRIAEKDCEIQDLKSQLAAESQKIQTLSIRVAAQEAKRTHLLASRVLSRYGRIKYRYLLPIYRLRSEEHTSELQSPDHL